MKLFNALIIPLIMALLSACGAKSKVCDRRSSSVDSAAVSVSDSSAFRLVFVTDTTRTEERNVVITELELSEDWVAGDSVITVTAEGIRLDSRRVSKIRRIETAERTEVSGVSSAEISSSAVVRVDSVRLSSVSSSAVRTSEREQYDPLSKWLLPLILIIIIIVGVYLRRRRNGG